MNHTIQLIANTDQHAKGLARAVGAFLSTEASGLTEILETVGEFDAADAVRHLTELCQAPRPDAGHIAGTLDEVLDGLLHIPFLLIDQAAYAGMGPRDLHGAIRWYGGRISDLADRARM